MRGKAAQVRGSKRCRSTTTTCAVKEPATNVVFDDSVGPLTCIGAGVREKKIAILNVKVYAVALYVDAEGCKAAVGSGKTLMDGSFDKTIVVELVRDVDGKTFWNALDEAVAPRIREIATNLATAEDDEGNFMSETAEKAEVAEEAAMDDSDELRDFFLSQDLKKGTRVSLAWQPTASEGDTALTIDIGGKADISLKSQEFAQAVFDVYLGDGPVSPGALDAFKAGAAAL